VRITKIETITAARGVDVHVGNVGWLWVRVHTDAGHVGLGETYPLPLVEEAVVLSALAPVLIGRDPRDVERLWTDMLGAVRHHGWAGAEMRAISAVDIALWDLRGKALGEPVYRLLGGRCRDRIPTYNTCYDHVHDFDVDAGALARDLMASGIRAMKIWPFDRFHGKTLGQRIAREDLEAGLAPVRKVREAVGDAMELALEFHGFWSLPAALEIARAVEPYRIMWLEEMLPQDNVDAYAALQREVRTPLVLSERFMTRFQFREVITRGIARFVNPDLAWCGGLTEARKIASLADTYFLPVAPHNCGGPVLHFASLHLAASLPNLFLLESVRRHYLKEYVGVVTDTGAARDGAFDPPERPGLGVELDPALLARPDVRVRSV